MIEINLIEEIGKNYSPERFQRDFDLIMKGKEKLNKAKTDWEISKFKEFVRNQNHKELILYDADENCKHEIVPQIDGGIKCIKCGGWFCY